MQKSVSVPHNASRSSTFSTSCSQRIVEVKETETQQCLQWHVPRPPAIGDIAASP